MELRLSPAPPRSAGGVDRISTLSSGGERSGRSASARSSQRIFEPVFTSKSDSLSLLRPGSLFGLPAPSPRASGTGGVDRISDLPDDLLLLVLARLCCVRTAARASVLSRRWRGLWTRLPTLVFRDVPFPSVKPVLARVVSSGSTSTVSRLVICPPNRPFSVREGERRVSLASLLRTAARLSPEQLILAIPSGEDFFNSVELPCFERATSIWLHSRVAVWPPATGELFPALTTLVLSGCASAAYPALEDLVLRCPRLRVLRYTLPAGFLVDITVRSLSLRELFIEDTSDRWTWIRNIDVTAPMLERLTLSSHVRDPTSFSVLAPMASNISWRCHYNGGFKELPDWTLQTVSLLSTTTRAAAADGPQLPVLRIAAIKEPYYYRRVFWAQDDFSRELEKHLRMQVAVHFSVLDLELHLAPLGHVYGAVAFYFLRMHKICTAIRRLKVAVPQSTDKEKCQEYCGCEPADWTSQIVSLTKLEEVEIDGFQGDKREFDFLEHLLKCAPILINVILKHSGEGVPSEAKIHEFSLAHPSVDWHYVISSGSVSM
ncbi:putative F-box/FBD/LRR-repeat protein At4g03220 [Triticum aestivum]|uniref:putative F-box/FBD/LRR-repeat protein At4g03220 n=1 Tax=Triticum aestivum TaxID=4565 RepID=UPI0008446CDE|nr:putative F-box/FBD/LRR-repeat protein At4g03220 [Triticum aestivum]